MITSTLIGIIVTFAYLYIKAKRQISYINKKLSETLVDVEIMQDRINQMIGEANEIKDLVKKK
jgi:pilus assembly protein TadC